MRSHFSRVQLCDRMDCSPPGSSILGDSRDKNTGVGCHPPGDLPDPGIEPTSLMSPALADGFFTSVATWKAQNKEKGGQKGIWSYLDLWGRWLQVKGRLNNHRRTLCPNSRGASQETEWCWGGELGSKGSKLGNEMSHYRMSSFSDNSPLSPLDFQATPSSRGKKRNAKVLEFSSFSLWERQLTLRWKYLNYHCKFPGKGAPIGPVLVKCSFSVQTPVTEAVGHTLDIG